MLVKDAMTVDFVACTPETNLAAVVGKMWEHDRGVIPVVDENSRVIGMVTDRDICIAVGTRDVRPSEIAVHEVMSEDVAAVRTDDDIQDAVRIMREHKVRRLPVVDADGTLKGILTLNEMTKLAADDTDVSVSYGELVGLLQSFMGRQDKSSVVN